MSKRRGKPFSEMRKHMAWSVMNSTESAYQSTMRNLDKNGFARDFEGMNGLIDLAPVGLSGDMLNKMLYGVRHEYLRCGRVDDYEAGRGQMVAVIRGFCNMYPKDPRPVPAGVSYEQLLEIAEEMAKTSPQQAFGVLTTWAFGLRGSQTPLLTTRNVYVEGNDLVASLSKQKLGRGARVQHKMMLEKHVCAPELKETMRGYLEEMRVRAAQAGAASLALAPDFDPEAAADVIRCYAEKMGWNGERFKEYTGTHGLRHGSAAAAKVRGGMAAVTALTAHETAATAKWYAMSPTERELEHLAQVDAKNKLLRAQAATILRTGLAPKANRPPAGKRRSTAAARSSRTTASRAGVRKGSGTDGAAPTIRSRRAQTALHARRKWAKSADLI